MPRGFRGDERELGGVGTVVYRVPQPVNPWQQLAKPPTEALDTSNRANRAKSRSPRQLKANTSGGTKRWMPTTREEMHQMQAALNGRPPPPGL